VVGRIRFALERFASPRHRSHVAQLYSLGIVAMIAIKHIILPLCVVSICGCASTLVVSKATEHQDYDEKTDKMVGPVNYGYYCLLPVTVPWDIVTFPIQCIAMPFMLKDQH